MNAGPRALTYVLAALAVPVLVLVMVPVVVLLALAMYLRALVIPLGQLLGLGQEERPASFMNQLSGPHFGDAVDSGEAATGTSEGRKQEEP